MAKAVKDASEKATRLLGAHKPASRRLTVLLDPSVSASFLGLLSSGLSASSVIKGRSLFAGREGEAVAVPFLTLVDDPTQPEAWGAGRYDAEGLASRRNVLISEGVLRGFLHNSYTGRRCSQPSNASAVRGGYRSTPGAGSRALSLTPGDRSQEQLMADVGEGLLVQSVTGLHSGANRAGAGGNHRLHPPAHAARPGGRGRGQGVAAGWRRRPDHRHRRRPAERLVGG